MPPDHRPDFSPKSNLYKLLESRFSQVKRLTDHYRCMPEIIHWCSDRFYGHSLTPLRQFGADRLPPLRLVQIDDGYTVGRQDQLRNPVEAERLVATLKRLLADPAYEDRSFGVIALQSHGQARYIDKLLDTEIPDPALREKHRLRVGMPDQFQGDQRDVILLSMVVCGSPQPLSGTLFDQRFNVAVSRAGDQLWLFSSVPAHRLSEADLRYSLLAYMQTPQTSLTSRTDLGDVTAHTLHPAFDSLFEQRVFLAIRDRGYRVIPHFEAGNSKTIDLVVVGDSTRLAVECDGSYWHSTHQQLRRDLLRERELRRAGWQFWRLAESDFQLDPDQALQPLWERLAQHGIHPAP